MRRPAALLALALALGACAGPDPSPQVATPTLADPSPTAKPSPTPVPSFGTYCGYGLEESRCAEMRDAALAAVAPSRHKPIHVWLGGGVLCPFVDHCLFNPLGNFPVPQPPAGSEATLPMGNAEVAFADTDEHAGMNLYPVNGKVVAQLIGYRVPDRDWCSGECPTAQVRDGAIDLQLVLPHLDWHADEPIVGGQAIMDAPLTIYGPTAPIAFGYRDVDGGRHSFGPAFDAACKPTPRAEASAFNVPLAKSGSYDAAQPDAAWIGPFLQAEGVQLPAGTWDITAYARFSDDADCSGAGHELQTTLRVTVTP